MQIFHYHPKTLELVGAGVADANPLEEGNWLVPAHATEIEPPPYLEGKTIRFVDGAWEYQDIPAPSPVVTPPWSRDPLLNKVRSARQYALNALIGIITTEKENTPPSRPLIDACLAARQALLDMTKLPAVVEATDDVSLTVALVQAYGAIVIAAPAAIKNAFADMHL
jgi:hypothetical protein